MYRYSKSTVTLPEFRIPDFRVIGPSENRLKSDMSDSPDFYSSEIRGDRFTDFCLHTARLSGNRLQKIGQWDHGIIREISNYNKDNHHNSNKMIDNLCRPSVSVGGCNQATTIILLTF